MRVFVFVTTVLLTVAWSWWSTRLAFQTFSRIRSAVLFLIFFALFGANVMVPLFTVGWAFDFAFGPLPLPRWIQILPILLGSAPMLFFCMRHSQRWKPPVSDGSSKA